MTPAPTLPADDAALRKLKVNELKALCAHYALPQTGVKADLLARLEPVLFPSTASDDDHAVPAIAATAAPASASPLTSPTASVTAAAHPATETETEAAAPSHISTRYPPVPQYASLQAHQDLMQRIARAEKYNAEVAAQDKTLYRAFKFGTYKEPATTPTATDETKQKRKGQSVDTAAVTAHLALSPAAKISDYSDEDKIKRLRRALKFGAPDSAELQELKQWDATHNESRVCQAFGVSAADTPLSEAKKQKVM
ncbi:hypothetical protein RI367_006904 [Sorochytrium milnesiophthora]